MTLLLELCESLESRKWICSHGFSVVPIGSAWERPDIARDIDLLILLDDGVDRRSLFQDFGEILHDIFPDTCINAVADFIPYCSCEQRSLHVAIYDEKDLLARKPRVLLNALSRTALYGECSWKQRIAETYWSIADLQEERWGLKFCKYTLERGYWASRGWFETMLGDPCERRFYLYDQMVFEAMIRYSVSKGVRNVLSHDPRQTHQLSNFLEFSRELSINWSNSGPGDFDGWLQALDRLLIRCERLPQVSGEVLAQRLVLMDPSLDAILGSTKGN